MKIIIPTGVHRNIRHDVSDRMHAVEYHVEQNAHVTIVHEQNMPLAQTYEQTITFFMGAGSNLHYFPIMLGAQQSTLTINVILEKNAHAIIQGAYALNGAQEHTIMTTQQHVGQQSHSVLTINGIASEKAMMHYQGVIAIEENAARVTASQENKTILCSNTARAVSVPSLEVKNNDVQCAHGSAVGPLQQDLIYYLQARGISALQAQQILLESFFGQTLATLHDEQQKKYFIEQLVAKASIREQTNE